MPFRPPQSAAPTSLAPRFVRARAPVRARASPGRRDPGAHHLPLRPCLEPPTGSAPSPPCCCSWPASSASTAPPTAAACRLLAGADPLPADALTYAPWLVASVEVRAAPRGIGARLAQRQRLLAGDPHGWKDHVVAALAAMHPGIAAEVSHVAVTRWGHAMIRPVPGLLFGEALTRARAPLGRLRPCAADVAGLPLFEEAFYQGSSAALAALADLGRSAPDALADELPG